MKKAYVQVYTGNGKGKTTAAIGIAMRQVCAGGKVFMGQFVKGMPYAETKLQDKIENFKMEQWGRDCFIFNKPSQIDIDMAKKGMERAKELVSSGEYTMVILDELNIALYYNLVSIEDVFDLLDKRREDVELIITGRYAPEELIQRADLCTEMTEIKHYYKMGVQAREGIEK